MLFNVIKIVGSHFPASDFALAGLDCIFFCKEKARSVRENYTSISDITNSAHRYDRQELFVMEHTHVFKPRGNGQHFSELCRPYCIVWMIVLCSQS